MQVDRPVQQMPHGKDGMFQLMLVEQRKKTLKDLRVRSEKSSQPPLPPQVSPSPHRPTSVFVDALDSR